MRTIYLDMDEVIVDFTGATLKLFGKDKSCLISGEWMISKWIGITHDEMWEVLDAQGIDFWINIEPYPWAHELVEQIQMHSEVVIASTPSMTSIWSPSGKMGWLQNFFNDPKFINYTLIRDKWRLSNPKALLIDDKPSNCERFEKRPDGIPSGESVLFPADWHKDLVDDKVGFTIDRVREWEERVVRFQNP